jgi:hypothetical protein
MKALSCSSVAEHLQNMYETPDPVPSIAQAKVVAFLYISGRISEKIYSTPFVVSNKNILD